MKGILNDMAASRDMKYCGPVSCFRLQEWENPSKRASMYSLDCDLVAGGYTGVHLCDIRQKRQPPQPPPLPPPPSPPPPPAKSKHEKKGADKKGKKKTSSAVAKKGKTNKNKGEKQEKEKTDSKGKNKKKTTARTAVSKELEESTPGSVPASTLPIGQRTVSGQRACYQITVVRDPVTRLVSSWEYCKSFGNDQLCATKHQAAGPASILEWAWHQRRYLQLQLLVNAEDIQAGCWWAQRQRIEKRFDVDIRNNGIGVPADAQKQGYLNRQLQEKSFAALRSEVSAVGLVENFSKSLELFECVTGLPFVQIGRQHMEAKEEKEKTKSKLPACIQSGTVDGGKIAKHPANSFSRSGAHAHDNPKPNKPILRYGDDTRESRCDSTDRQTREALYAEVRENKEIMRILQPDIEIYELAKALFQNQTRSCSLARGVRQRQL